MAKDGFAKITRVNGGLTAMGVVAELGLHASAIRLVHLGIS